MTSSDRDAWARPCGGHYSLLLPFGAKESRRAHNPLSAGRKNPFEVPVFKASRTGFYFICMICLRGFAFGRFLPGLRYRKENCPVKQRQTNAAAVVVQESSSASKKKRRKSDKSASQYADEGQARCSASMSAIMATRRAWRPPSNSASRNACRMSSARQGPITRAPMHSTLASLWLRVRRAL